MKLRKFYPSQVIRQLAGRSLSGLDVANRCAFTLGLQRSRRMGVVITVVDDRIDVSNAAQLGRLMLDDLKTAMQKTLSARSVALPVLVKA